MLAGYFPFSTLSASFDNSFRLALTIGYFVAVPVYQLPPRDTAPRHTDRTPEHPAILIPLLVLTVLLALSRKEPIRRC